MAEASRPTNPGVAVPVSAPEAGAGEAPSNGAAGAPAGTVSSVHDRPTLTPTGKVPEDGA